MKQLIIPLLLAAGTVSAAPDIDRIRKDVTVMSNIIEGAFESDADCKKCDPNIETSYLVNQGAVFTIRESSWRSFQLGEGEDFSGFSFVMPPSEPEAVRRVEITQMVGDILDDVGVVMDEVGSHIEMSLGELEDGERFLRIDSDTRRDLRELNRKRRELEYQRREYEIELIHEENEQKRLQIESQVKEIEDKISKLERKQNELNKVFENERLEKEKALQAKRERLKEQHQAMAMQVENVVLRSLCDYGATLRHLPDNEHVSVVFERKREGQKRVFVMKADDITGCKNPEVLRKDATTYLF